MAQLGSKIVPKLLQNGTPKETCLANGQHRFWLLFTILCLHLGSTSGSENGLKITPHQKTAPEQHKSDNLLKLTSQRGPNWLPSGTLLVSKMHLGNELNAKRQQNEGKAALWVPGKPQLSPNGCQLAAKTTKNIRKNVQCCQWMFLSSVHYESLQEHVFELTGRQQISELTVEICSCCWQHV